MKIPSADHLLRRVGLFRFFPSLLLRQRKQTSLLAKGIATPIRQVTEGNKHLTDWKRLSTLSGQKYSKASYLRRKEASRRHQLVYIA